MFARFFLLICSLIVVDGFAQNNFTVKKDLSDAWRGYEGKKFYDLEPALAADHETIHLQLSPGEYPGQYLRIHSAEIYFLFVDGKAVAELQGTLLLNIDSLSKRYVGRRLLFSLYQERGIQAKTEIVTLGSPPNSLEMERKPSSDMKNFAALAGLGLIIFFVVMLTAHPKLSSEYFSLRRILAMREVDDTESHARFALSSNLLFYVFLSVLIAFFLVLLSPHLSEEYSLFMATTSSYSGMLVQWITLSLYIIGFLFLKALLIVALSALFGLRGIAGIHFLNNMRLLLLVTSALCSIAFVYFISGGRDQTVYNIFLLLLIFTLVAWVVLAFFKLSSRTETFMFHLFSYICATEVIPLLLLMKVLFD